MGFKIKLLAWLFGVENKGFLRIKDSKVSAVKNVRGLGLISGVCNIDIAMHSLSMIKGMRCSFEVQL